MSKHEEAKRRTEIALARAQRLLPAPLAYGGSGGYVAEVTESADTPNMRATVRIAPNAAVSWGADGRAFVDAVLELEDFTW